MASDGPRRRLLVAVAIMVVIAGAATFAWRSRAVNVPLIGEDTPTVDTRGFEEVAFDKVGRSSIQPGNHFALGFVAPTSNRIPIQLEGGYCVGEREATQTRLDHVDVEETATSVTLRPYTVDPEAGSRLCAGVGSVFFADAELDAPIGGRAVVNGFNGRTETPSAIARSDRLPAGSKRCAGSVRFGRRLRAEAITVSGISCRKGRHLARTVRGVRRFRCGGIGGTRVNKVLCLRAYGVGAQFQVVHHAHQ